MYYLFFASYRDDDNILEKRLAARDEHVARIKELNEAGRILAAGPYLEKDGEPKITDYVGSAIIAEFDSLEEAQAWADEEPFLKAGVYKELLVRPYLSLYSNQDKK